MKFAVTSYSFTQYVKQGKMTWIECIAKAKELGFDGIEFTNQVFEGVDDKIALAKELRAEARKVGIEVANLAVGADLLSEDGVDKAKEWVDVANALGVPTMRHDVASDKGLKHYEGYDNVLPRLADACREITEYAKGFGIKTMTENHGYFSQDSLRVEKLINTVAHENFGQLVDMGNFLCADDDPVIAVGRCAKYAFYVHAKDFIVKSGNGYDPGDGFFVSRGGNFLRGTIVGHGDVPVINCLRALKKAGYDGWLSVEFEGMEDCIRGIEIGLKNLKRYCEAVNI